MTDVGLTHVALEVSDLDASIAFYESYAGMHVVHRRPQVVWLSDKTRPFVIVLLEVPEVRACLRPFAHL
ncbi:MAG: VOC family protein, partial [Myxococcota bacterium]